jgi:hypothetical protein
MSAISRMIALVFLLALVAVSVQADAADQKTRYSRRDIEVAPADLAEVPPGPAYRFSDYPGAEPQGFVWGYLFGTTYSASPAFNYYAPGYRTGPAFADPPTGNYYQSPCYFEAQQIWDGARWSIKRTRICR